MPQPSKSMPSALVALAGWVLPGSGYLLIGQRARGYTVGITILILFVLGLLIGGMRVVEAPNFAEPLRAVAERPWFVPQVLAGPVALLASHLGSGQGYVVSHSRINDIGTLYAAVAGMLNLLAIIDSAHRAATEGRS